MPTRLPSRSDRRGPGGLGRPPRHRPGCPDAVDRHILAEEPATVWKAGRTATRAFPLFSYRVFHHLHDIDDDPVVVGLTFTVRDASVRVAGDISGDESGFIYFDEGCTVEVPHESRAVKEAARLVADRLASRESVVLEAIRHRPPRATP